MCFASTESFRKALGLLCQVDLVSLLLPPVLSQCHRGWKRADLPGRNLLSAFSNCTLHLLVAEGVVTGVGRPRFWLGRSATLNNLLIYNFLICKMKNMIYRAFMRVK